MAYWIFVGTSSWSSFDVWWFFWWCSTRSINLLYLSRKGATSFTHLQYLSDNLCTFASSSSIFYSIGFEGYAWPSELIYLYITSLVSNRLLSLRIYPYCRRSTDEEMIVSRRELTVVYDSLCGTVNSNLVKSFFDIYSIIKRYSKEV